MKTSSYSRIALAVLAFAWPAMAQTPAETILPAIIPPSSGQAAVKAKAGNGATAVATPSASTRTSEPAHATGVVVNPTPTRPAVSPPHATLPSENSSPRPDPTVTYYIPVGAVSPQSGIRTYPGTTAAHLTHGATRAASSGMRAGSTFARLAGSVGSRASRPSTRAITVGTR